MKGFLILCVVNIFCLSSSDTHLMPNYFSSELCRDFQFATALWMSKETKNSTYFISCPGNFQTKHDNRCNLIFLLFVGALCTTRFINAFQSWQFSFNVTNHPNFFGRLKSVFMLIHILFKTENYEWISVIYDLHGNIKYILTFQNYKVLIFKEI